MIQAAHQPQPGRRIRVMIVDDSAVVRGLTRRWLEADPRIELVGACVDGAQAVNEIANRKPDVVILDVEMPNKDGLSALPELRRALPSARIVMASTLTSAGATTTIRALQLGAADFICKPDATGIGSASSYRDDLIAKVVALGERAAGAVAPARFTTRRTTQAVRPEAMVVAASTGGPSALPVFLGQIARRIEAPILIVQHMPPSFMPVFAEKLGQAVGKPAHEAREGEEVRSGMILVAPGDRHMRVVRDGERHLIRLDQGPPVNFCRPAADPLFESAASAYGSKLLAVVLTGMGHDGRDGCAKIAGAGGRVIVQDEASSVVWGMPGAVALAGHAEAVKPLDGLGSLALNMMNGVPA